VEKPWSRISQAWAPLSSMKEKCHLSFHLISIPRNSALFREEVISPWCYGITLAGTVHVNELYSAPDLILYFLERKKFNPYYLFVVLKGSYQKRI
jgi:hypothetical protein